MERVIHAYQIIHSGVETPHYTAQEAQFRGEKRSQESSGSQGGTELNQDGPNVSYVYLQKHPSAIVRVGGGQLKTKQ